VTEKNCKIDNEIEAQIAEWQWEVFEIIIRFKRSFFSFWTHK